MKEYSICVDVAPDGCVPTPSNDGGFLLSSDPGVAQKHARPRDMGLEINDV